MKSLSRVWLLATPWTSAYQNPPSKGFSREEYWSGVTGNPNRSWTTFPRVPGHLGLGDPLWAVYFLHFHQVMEMSMRAVHAKLLQLCPTLGDPMDCSPPGSSVHGIFQARVLECLSPHAKIDSKWINALNIRAKDLELLGKNRDKSSWPWS